MRNLKKNNISFETEKIRFYFSTEARRRRFVERYGKNRKEVAERIFKRYKVNLESEELADIYLYQRLEPNGFYIEAEGACYEWAEAVKLSGLKVMRAQYRPWYGDLTQK